jgi:hypothetical protein
MALVGGSLVGCGSEREPRGQPEMTARPGVAPTRGERMDELEQSEAVIESLGPALHGLAKSVLHLELPGPASLRFFADEVSVVEFADFEQARGNAHDSPLGIRSWEVPTRSEATRGPASGLTLWNSFLGGVDYFEHFSFYNVRGKFVAGDRSRYQTDSGFKGLARSKRATWVYVHGDLSLTWVAPVSEGGPWRIESLVGKHFDAAEAASLPFEDVLDRVIRDPAQRLRARGWQRSEMFAGFIAHIRNGTKKLEEFVAFLTKQLLEKGDDSTLGAAGVAIVDINGDGWEDFFVGVPDDEPAMLFVNRGNGTFEQRAKQLGLDYKFVRSALFADFDNDGDPDAFLARNLERSLYLSNDNGRFVDRSASHVGVPLPHFALSIAAADYNGDGLLDVYLTTGFTAYGVATQWDAIHRAEQRGEAVDKKIHAGYLSDQQASELYARMSAPPAHPVLHRPGPPNLLLENLGGGKFAPDPDSNDTLALWQQSLAATWGDYDADGDEDLYVANDFGPNRLFRNDGSGKFEEISETTGTADIGFGMGASWGDYDEDGRLDLYVTNMFSKAGRRITATAGSEQRIAQMARGNSLFRQRDDGSFEKVSGLEAPAQLVEAGGWGWGSQFVDVDNDGDLDIYAMSGNYSIPKEVAAVGDS